MMLTSNGADQAAKQGEMTEQVRRRTVESIATTMNGGPRAIEARLTELDEEWDAESVLQASAGALILLGTGLAVSDRRWLALPALLGALFMENARSRRFMPHSLFRSMGLRTRRQIDHERYALKAARGDFDALDVASAAGPNTLLTVTEF